MCIGDNFRLKGFEALDARSRFFESCSTWKFWCVLYIEDISVFKFCINYVVYGVNLSIYFGVECDLSISIWLLVVNVKFVHGAQSVLNIYVLVFFFFNNINAFQNRILINEFI